MCLPVQFSGTSALMIDANSVNVFYRIYMEHHEVRMDLTTAVIAPHLHNGDKEIQFNKL